LIRTNKHKVFLILAVLCFSAFDSYGKISLNTSGESEKVSASASDSVVVEYSTSPVALAKSLPDSGKSHPFPILILSSTDYPGLLFQLGVLKGIEQYQLPVSHISASGWSAIAATLWAAGYSADSLYAMLSAENLKSRFPGIVLDSGMPQENPSLLKPTAWSLGVELKAGVGEFAGNTTWNAISDQSNPASRFALLLSKWFIESPLGAIPEDYSKFLRSPISIGASDNRNAQPILFESGDLISHLITTSTMENPWEQNSDFFDGYFLARYPVPDNVDDYPAMIVANPEPKRRELPQNESQLQTFTRYLRNHQSFSAKVPVFLVQPHSTITAKSSKSTNSAEAYYQSGFAQVRSVITRAFGVISPEDLSSWQSDAVLSYDTGVPKLEAKIRLLDVEGDKSEFLRDKIEYDVPGAREEALYASSELYWEDLDRFLNQQSSAGLLHNPRISLSQDSASNWQPWLSSKSQNLFRAGTGVNWHPVWGLMVPASIEWAFVRHFLIRLGVDARYSENMWGIKPWLSLGDSLQPGYYGGFTAEFSNEDFAESQKKVQGLLQYNRSRTHFSAGNNAEGLSWKGYLGIDLSSFYTTDFDSILFSFTDYSKESPADIRSGYFGYILSNPIAFFNEDPFGQWNWDAGGELWARSLPSPLPDAVDDSLKTSFFNANVFSSFGRHQSLPGGFFLDGLLSVGKWLQYDPFRMPFTKDLLPFMDRLNLFAVNPTRYAEFYPQVEYYAQEFQLIRFELGWEGFDFAVSYRVGLMNSLQDNGFYSFAGPENFHFSEASLLWQPGWSQWEVGVENNSWVDSRWTPHFLDSSPRYWVRIGASLF